MGPSRLYEGDSVVAGSHTWIQNKNLLYPTMFWTRATHKCVVQMSHNNKKQQKYLNFLSLDYKGLHDSCKIVAFLVLQILKNVPIV